MIFQRTFNLFLFLFSREVLLSRFVLQSLFWVNLLGTVYGFEWYWNQLEYTAKSEPLWMTLLVPDSPTASLFFTLCLLFLLRDPAEKKNSGGHSFLRSFVETFAAVTLFKYGVWAVTMIFAAAAQGDPLSWKDWMLSVSHLGMAAEALLFVRFFRIMPYSLLFVGVWTLFNDFADYGFGIFPWLPDELMDELVIIQWFTVGLSFASLAVVLLLKQLPEKSRV